MATGIEESFVIRLQQKYRPLMTKAQADRLLVGLKASELMLKDDYSFDEESNYTRGKIYNYDRKFIFNNVSWTGSHLTHIVTEANRYKGDIIDFFKGKQDTSFTHGGLNISWGWYEGGGIISELTADEVKALLYTQLEQITGYDFHDIGSILNMHKVEFMLREEFTDKPSFVLPAALVGGVKITGQIINGTYYLVDIAALMLATENLFGVLTEDAIGVLIEQSGENIINDQGHRIDDVHPVGSPFDLHTEKGDKLHTEGDDQFITEK